MYKPHLFSMDILATPLSFRPFLVWLEIRTFHIASQREAAIA
jgi:hypothetical protein